MISSVDVAGVLESNISSEHAHGMNDEKKVSEMINKMCDRNH
jgi:hypothetical protein